METKECKKMYNRTKKEIHDRIVVLHAEERQQGIVKDALDKLSEQERRSTEIKYRVWDKDRKEYLSAGNVFIGIHPGEMQALLLVDCLVSS